MIAAVEHLGERIGEIEAGREGAAADATAIAGMVEEIRADQAATTRVLGELVRGVERWHSPSAAARRPEHSAPAQRPPPTAQNAQAEPPGGFASWVATQDLLDGETMPERARRLRPIYNAKHDLSPPADKRPAPSGGFVAWVSAQPFANENEKPQERARRLIPIYNAQFDPPYTPPGAA